MSPFARAQGDPLEEYCLALLLKYPALKEVAQDISPDLFVRPEHRELFRQWMQHDTIEMLEKSLDPLLLSHLKTLLERPLLSLDSQARETAVREVSRRLRERSLREAKLQEGQALGSVEAEEEGWQERVLKANEELRKLLMRQRRT